jgi:hypothetical protein
MKAIIGQHIGHLMEMRYKVLNILFLPKMEIFAWEIACLLIITVNLLMVDGLLLPTTITRLNTRLKNYRQPQERMKATIMRYAHDENDKVTRLGQSVQPDNVVEK